MKRIILALFLVLILANIGYSYSCNKCDDCAVVFEWTTDGLPNHAELTSLFYQVLPSLNEIDCATVTNANNECFIFEKPRDFLQFDYTNFASSICETTTLKFYDCSSVPIPGTGLLLLSGLAGLGFIRRKKDE